MINSISGFFRNESGKAESKVPATITIIILISILYWGVKYGIPHYKDFMFKTEVQKMLKYDPFRTKRRPSDAARRADILVIAKEFNIDFTERSNEQFLTITPDSSGQWFSAHYRYKRIIKHPVGQPKIKWFEHKLIPE